MAFSLRIALAACTLIGAAPLLAQEPFSTVELQVQVARNVNRSLLHDYWEPGAGGAASASTPFYLGFLEFGGALHRYQAAADVPGFGALWLYGAWGMQAVVASRLRLEAGLHLGNYRMSFDSAGTEFSGAITESELVLGTSIRAAFRLAGPVSVFAALRGLSVRTAPRMELWYGATGISATLATPPGLRSFSGDRAAKLVWQSLGLPVIRPATVSRCTTRRTDSHGRGPGTGRRDTP